MGKDKQMHCDACGGKLQHPYAQLGNKEYCRRSCYEKGIKEKVKQELNDKLADEHRHEEAARKIGCWDGEYPDNTSDC